MEQRDFKGVWIPKSVWLDSRLNALDKIILMEIDSLDTEENGCYASNEYLSNFCQCSERKVSEAISKLTEFNYIYLESFNGRTRVLRSMLSNSAKQTSKICEAETQKTPPIKIEENTNINNKEISIINNTKEMEIFEHWNKKNIIIHRDFNKLEKKIKEALKEHDLETIKSAIDHYSEVINNQDYFYKYKWTLEQFLSRGKGLVEFTDKGSKWLNYLDFKNKNKSKEISRQTAYPEYDDVGYIR